MTLALLAARTYRFSEHGLLGFLVLLALSGLIIGAVARLIVPGRQSMGILATIGVGILGSFVGGLIGRLLFGPGYVPGFLISVAGAALLIWLLFRRRGRTV